MRPKLNKSDIVLCPDCSSEIAELAHDIQQNDNITFTTFRFFQNKEPLDNSPVCRECGALWVLMQNKLMIKGKGVVP